MPSFRCLKTWRLHRNHVFVLIFNPITFLSLTSTSSLVWYKQLNLHSDLQGSRVLCQPLSEEVFTEAACSVVPPVSVYRETTTQDFQKTCWTPAEEVKVFCTCCCNCTPTQCRPALGVLDEGEDFCPAAMIRWHEREEKIWFLIKRRTRRKSCQ